MDIPIGPGRAPDAPLLLLSIDRDADRPLFEQVYRGLREAIVHGRLAPGARLPSTRALAADLDVSRSTVVLAFDQLRLEGYTEGRRGGGTHVRSAIPDRLLRPAAARGRGERAGKEAGAARGMEKAGTWGGMPPNGKAAEPGLSRRGELLARAGQSFRTLAGRPPTPFELGVPAVDAFPARIWARLAGRRWRHGDIPLGDADPAGLPALREAVTEYVVQARAARCTADRVLITNGAQQALDLAARILLDPGDAVWTEDPGYFGARVALQAAGARLVPVPVDDKGMDVGAGERAAPDARLACVTPSHQFPLGAVMSAPRRLELLSWARRSGAWIVEDDYDSEFRYAGRPLPCLQGLEAERLEGSGAPRVLYVGTFSKTLIPGLRLGYLVVPDALVDAFRAARAVHDGHTPVAGQAVLADFLGEGHYARHLRRVRALCAERQSALRAAVAEELGGLLTVAPDPAGLHVVGRLVPGIEEEEAASAAAERDVIVSPLSRYYLAQRKQAEPEALLMGYAGFDEERIRSAVRRLGSALRAVAAR